MGKMSFPFLPPPFLRSHPASAGCFPKEGIYVASLRPHGRQTNEVYASSVHTPPCITRLLPHVLGPIDRPIGRSSGTENHEIEIGGARDRAATFCQCRGRRWPSNRVKADPLLPFSFVSSPMRAKRTYLVFSPLLPSSSHAPMDRRRAGEGGTIDSHLILRHNHNYVAPAG